MKEKIAIALSGGIDSLVSALILKQKGYKLFGVHFLTGFESVNDSDNKNNLISSLLEEKLKIPVETVDIRIEFKKIVVDYFIKTYESGLTPNPCLICNSRIKFGIIAGFAEKLGAKRLATGHYAKRIADDKGRMHLVRAKDPIKDQSYFLSFLKRSQLSFACFPLGNLKKSEVIKYAGDNKLSPVFSAESQDVCFIKNESYGEFLSRQKEFAAKPGLIEDLNGNMLGEHKGLHLFTIGQRKGINCPSSEPYYVVRMDHKNNRLVVGFKKDLCFSECTVKGINWIQEKPDSPCEVLTQIRYRNKAAPSLLIPFGDDSANIIFNDMQTSISPGQGAVFYKNDEVLGGGIIESGK
jgi:tRNA-specific 2-thiouridylase